MHLGRLVPGDQSDVHGGCAVGGAFGGSGSGVGAHISGCSIVVDLCLGARRGVGLGVRRCGERLGGDRQGRGSVLGDRGRRRRVGRDASGESEEGDAACDDEVAQMSHGVVPSGGRDSTPPSWTPKVRAGCERGAEGVSTTGRDQLCRRSAVSTISCVDAADGEPTTPRRHPPRRRSRSPPTSARSRHPPRTPVARRAGCRVRPPPRPPRGLRSTAPAPHEPHHVDGPHGRVLRPRCSPTTSHELHRRHIQPISARTRTDTSANRADDAPRSDRDR